LEINMKDDEDYPTEIHEKLVERIMMGRSLLSICRDDDIPSHATILRWRRKWPDLDDAIARARTEGTHVLAEECLEIADRKDLEPQDKRVMIDTRLRLIGKWNARAYGEKVAMVGGGEDDSPVKVSHELDVSSLSLEQLDALQAALSASVKPT
jgi:hypothetical protein